VADIVQWYLPRPSFRGIGVSMRTSARTAAALLALVAAPAFAAGHVEAALGAATDIDGDGTQVATLAWVGGARHPWEFSLGHFLARNDLPDGYAPATTYVAAARRLTWHSFYAGGGIAAADADNEILSGTLQFLTMAGWQGEHVGVSLRHLSNADLEGRNRGETFLLLSWRF
jgi:hypothetical protein